jgi:hypothetical protein
MAKKTRASDDKREHRRLISDIGAWFAELDRFADVPFMEDGRHQPPMPEAADLF